MAFINLNCLASYLFTAAGWSTLMAKIREYRLCDDILAEYLNNDVVHIVMVPTICLKHPCKKYKLMGVADLEPHLSNFPIVDASSVLKDMQPFAVS